MTTPSPPPPPPPPLPTVTPGEKNRTVNAESFPETIKASSKKLRSTATLVTTLDGRLIRESRDMHGYVTSEVLSNQLLGFVGDVKPDLQVGEILPGLITGSQDVALDRAILSSHSVTHILNLASYVDNAYPLIYTYKKLQILDLPETDITQHFDNCFQFIDDCRASGGCVLVHCNAGVSRAATIVIAYLMKTQRMTFNDAFMFVKEKRPAIRPNDGFMHQLKEFGKGLMP